MKTVFYAQGDALHANSQTISKYCGLKCNPSGLRENLTNPAANQPYSRIVIQHRNLPFSRQYCQLSL